MSAKRNRRARLLVAGAFIALVCAGASAIAMNSQRAGSDGLLPPLPEESISPSSPPQEQPLPAPEEDGEAGTERGHEGENELGIPLAPGAATLAGTPASVVSRFAELWANRDTVLTEAMKREMVGLSAGAWASAVFQQARLTLPAIEGVRVEGEMVMMKITSVAPGSKTALVVTKERLLDPDGTLAAPRFELYLARLDQVTSAGYAITAWEPQR